jgi:carboxyl-terminal processing protease
MDQRRFGFASRLMGTACMMLLLIGAAPVKGSDLADALLDVHRGYALLETTFYHPVAPQTLLGGAQSALRALLQRYAPGTALPVAPVSSSDDVQAELDREIAFTAAAVHRPEVEVAYDALAGMAHAVDDRWTEFMTPEQYRRFLEALDPHRISGIGVLIDSDPRTRYIRASFVIPQTPAARAGLQSGDEIVSVDGVSTLGMTPDAASKRLRGPEGSVVRVVVMRDGRTLAPVAITREDVRPPTVVFKMLPGKIGYIYVLEFGESTAEEFQRALNGLEADGARALVLDLRNDGGGYVRAALDVLQQLVSGKPLLTVVERGAPAETIDAEREDVPGLPMVVLVNGYTASASEITAGALQDDGIAQLVGTRTFGKGVMQTLTPLPGGSAIKITTAHYLTPLQRDINLHGLQPNVVVNENADARFGDPIRDAQLRAGIEVLQKRLAAATRPEGRP